MRAIPIVLTILLSSCGWVEREREEAAAAAREATLVEVERMLTEKVRLAERHARSADRVLRPLPVMTPADEEALRRYRNEAHVAQGRALGIRAVSDSMTAALLADGRLIQLEDSTEQWIVRRGSSPALVVPEMRALLEVVGGRFQARLAQMGLPPYRMEVTSALRTSERQEELRESNSNAARGESSHEFGTTVDLSYAAFAPPAETPEDILEGVFAGFVPHLERFVDLALESVSARKSRELGAVFSEVLREAQSEGLALVIYERQQTVYHLTVGPAAN